MSANALTETAEAAPGETGDDHEPIFRVISTLERRRGVRLERIYWRLFDDIAKARGARRSDLLTEILSSSSGDEADNVSSAIRCFVADTLEQDRNVLRQRSDPSHVIGMMLRAPLPAFSINRHKKLQQVNSEFLQLVRPAEPSSGNRASQESVHLSLDTPIDDLFATTSGGQDTQCGYQLQVDDRRRRGRAKMVRVPGTMPETLVGYILS